MGHLDFVDILGEQMKQQREQAISQLVDIANNDLHNDLLKDVVQIVSLIAKRGRVQGLREALEGMTHFYVISDQDYQNAAYKSNKADRRTKEGKAEAAKQSELAEALYVVLEHIKENRSKSQ